MADKKASLILELKDMASAGIGKVQAALGGLRSVVLGVTAALGATIAVLAKALNEYGKQELAIRKLNQALESQGIKSEAVTQDLDKFADHLEKVTTVSGDVALSVMQVGLSMGISAGQIKEATTQAVGLSKAYNVDLQSAMKMVALAMQGEYTMMGRYIPQIRTATTQAEKAAIVQKALADGFRIAEAEAGTYAGRLIQMQNAFGKLAEEVGSYVVGPATAFLTWLRDATLKMAEFIGITKATAGPLGQRIDQQKKLAKELQDTIDRHEGLAGQETGYTERLKVSLEATKKQIAALEAQNKKMVEQEAIKGRSGPGGPSAPDADLAKLQADADARIQSVRFTEEQIAEIKVNAMADELIKKGDHVRAIELLEAHQTANAIKQNELRSRNMISTLQFISTMAGSSNKTLAALGKASGITMATIDTYAAANKALASAPPPFNFALAALVTAAGLANVAQISGVKLAEGGMIMPSAGGTSAIMAEAGKPEVAIPLDDERTAEKLRETLGGGNTIVIQAGAIVADEYSINQFAQKIDEKLYDLQRNRRSYL